MQAAGVLEVTEKKKSRKVGRPKAVDPLKAVISYKGTDDLEAWVQGLVEAADLGTRTRAVRQGLKLLAEKVGYEPPMPRR